MSMIKVNKENYQQVISSDYAVIDFYGANCGPCKVMAPVYQEVADDLAMIAFGSMCVDRDGNESFSRELNIAVVPTVRFYRNGVQVDEFTGSRDRREIDAYMTKLLYE